tara:strand:- start:115894 stop:116280 length:387 start_codon:yes stop_codon:yes gene_type:complete
MFGGLRRQGTRVRRDRGLTLVELTVAILVLAIGSVAALRAADQSRLAIGGGQDRVLAQLAARNRAEELRVLGGSGGGALPGVVVQAGRNFTLTTTTARTASGLVEATITARAPGGGGAVQVIYLPVSP